MLTGVSTAARRTLIVVLVLFTSLVLVALARRATDAPATSDTAVIESYTLMASKGQSLVGAYSRFQWHHPGPLYFFLLAPFYALSGDRTAGLNAGSAALSLASIALIVAVLMRRRPSLAVAVSASLALYAWRAAEAVASPWNPHVPLLPMTALIVVAADVLAGRARMLPIVAMLASLSGQAHIGLVPGAVVLGAVAFLRAVAGAVSSRETRSWRRSLVWTLAVLGLAWAPPLYEQLTGTPRGNITELWQFFAHQARHGQPLGVAVSAWSDMLIGVLRPDFYVAHGWPFVESPVRWAEALTLASLGLVAVWAARGASRRDSFVGWLGALLLLISGVALWSTTRIEERVFDHDVFWMTGIGILNLAAAADFGVAAALRRDDRMRAATGWMLCALFAGAAAVAAGMEVNRAVQRSFEPPAEARIARALANDINAFMTKEHVSRPLIKIDQDAWAYVAGAILDLQKQGRTVSVEDDWVVMFTPRFRITGGEEAAISVVMPAEHLRLEQQGVPLIASHDPIYAHVARLSVR